MSAYVVVTGINVYGVVTTQCTRIQIATRKVPWKATAILMRLFEVERLQLLSL